MSYNKTINTFLSTTNMLSAGSPYKPIWNASSIYNVPIDTNSLLLPGYTLIYEDFKWKYILAGENANATELQSIPIESDTSILLPGYTLNYDGSKWIYKSILNSIENGYSFANYIVWNSETNIWEIADGSVRLGGNAGQGQGFNSLSVGNSCGNLQKDYAISVGNNCGNEDQREKCIAIGNNSGEFRQGGPFNAVLVEEGYNSIAIGSYSGQYDQKFQSVAIGNKAGQFSQGSRALAIGYEAGQYNQGPNAVAIGNFAGLTNQTSGSIIINASTSIVNSSTSGFYVKPIRSSSSTSNGLRYDTGSNEIQYNSSKSFVINHPIDEDKYLVHACLEGPEAGVYYRGKAEIINNNFVEINLPEYTKSFNNFTVNITEIIDEKYIYKNIYKNIINFIKNISKSRNSNLKTSMVNNGKFIVYGDKNTSFFWTVYGNRLSIDTEPIKSNTIVKGDGPYKYIIN